MLAEGLPEICWVMNDVNKRPVLVRRGEQGYFPSAYHFEGVEAEKFVEEQNARLGVSFAQMKAMKAGSIFGFDKPIADPKQWE